MSDNVPPVTTSNIPLGWNNLSHFDVLLTAIDYADPPYGTPSGVFATYHTIDGSDPNAGSSTETTFTVTGQGSIPIKYYSIGNIGIKD